MNAYNIRWRFVDFELKPGEDDLLSSLASCSSPAFVVVSPVSGGPFEVMGGPTMASGVEQVEVPTVAAPLFGVQAPSQLDCLRLRNPGQTATKYRLILGVVEVQT